MSLTLYSLVYPANTRVGALLLEVGTLCIEGSFPVRAVAGD